MEKKKMKLWKKILIIILIILLFFIIITARKMVIMNNLENKSKQYTNLDNYQVTKFNYQGDNLQIFKTYKKGDKSLSIIKLLNENGTRSLTSYIDGNINHLYLDVQEAKIAILEGNGVPSPMQIYDSLYTENLWQKILMATFSNIKSEECNGKNCYKIELAFSPNYLYSENEKVTVFFDKETGLTVRKTDGTLEKNGKKTNIIADYYYEFNNVTDDDLKEPDISQYKIQEQDTNN